MQTLRVFIVIEGENRKDDLRIDGNLETLRAFLLGVGHFEIQDVATVSQPLISRREMKSKKIRKRRMKNENATQ